MLLGDIIINNARLFPEKTGVIDGQTYGRFTWKEVNQRVNRLSNALINMGIEKGDRVAVISENSSYCAELHFAFAKTGSIGCPLNYRLHPKQLESIINDAAPKAMFVQEKYVDLMNTITPQLDCVEHFILIGQESPYPHQYESLLMQYSDVEPKRDIRENDFFMITYSSGTTGLPKGVLATHKNRITYCLESCLFSDRYELNDIVLVSAPFCAGVSGQIQLAAPALVGATVIMYVLNGETWGTVIEKEKVTALITTKSRMMPVWEYMKNSGKTYDLSSLKKVTTGGQPHTESDLRQLLDFCEVSYTAKMYGLSETSATGCRLLPHEVAKALTPDAPEEEKRKLTSVGKPLLSMKLRLVDDEGKDVGPGEMGEVLFKGDSVSQEYWNKPELTNETFKNGWLHTKDMGILDEEGYLYLKGRKDFLIKSGGFLISPAEIEQVLLLHPAVKEAAVIGVPDEKWGEAVRAVLVLEKGKKVGEEELKEHCRKHLARFQVPKGFVFMDDLPKDETGRIQLKKVRKMYAI